LFHFSSASEQQIGIYTCLTGDSCDDDCVVDFERLVVDVDEHRLNPNCVLGDALSIPAPIPAPYPPGNYKATFEANWAGGDSSGLLPVIPTVVLQCENGEINLVETFPESIVCSKEGGSTLICTEDAGGSITFDFASTQRIRSTEYPGAVFVSNLIGFFDVGATVVVSISHLLFFQPPSQECSGSEFPLARAEMPPMSITRRDPYQSFNPERTQEVVFRVKLGILCESSVNKIRNSDQYVECYDNNYFNVATSPSITPLERQEEIFVCFSKLLFVGSGAPDGPDITMSSALTGAYTDFRWPLLADASCFDAIPQPTPPPVPQPTPALQVPQPQPAPAPTPVCFSGSAEVQAEGKGATRMDALKIGDSVMTGDGSYSKVYSFGHFAPNEKAEYLQIHADSMETPLEISVEHMLYANGKLAPAAQVKVGDMLVSGHGPPVEVKSIRKITSRGAYAPLTTTGDIVVNGVIASSYVCLSSTFEDRVPCELQGWIQHAALTPYRIYCGLVGCENETYDEATGLSKAVRMWLSLLHWLKCSTITLSAFLYLVVLPGQWIVLNMVNLAVATLGYYIWMKAINKNVAKVDSEGNTAEKPAN